MKKSKLNPEFVSALEAMNEWGTECVNSGFEMGQIHADCAEVQEILAEMERLTHRLLDHHSTCPKR